MPNEPVKLRRRIAGGSCPSRASSIGIIHLLHHWFGSDGVLAVGCLAPHQQTRGAGWKPLRWSASSKASRLTSGFAKGDELGAQRLWTRRTARPAPVFELDHAVVDADAGGSLKVPWWLHGAFLVVIPCGSLGQPHLHPIHPFIARGIFVICPYHSSMNRIPFLGSPSIHRVGPTDPGTETHDDDR
ncbi:hypothetical protein BGZ61DRAFT_62116 [Ilyonectria robusta]|uniref:uncharacterized protein n=1 Tax=Ilyonectria robusta TaxID=1079257 RepID=UPI001E8DB8E7|nr:uncharacterized protein BGZ61DRAFT_62116 [Ilyonectria robusta]KAH8683451.1 hypothetical protein BGZ61DRAFT_62116 [Ilyonectria robusta]